MLYQWWKAIIISVKINYNLNWPYIRGYPYRILVISRPGSGKANVLLNLTQNQPWDIDKIYLYVKYPFESKYQSLINGRANVGIKKTKNPEPSVYSQTIDDVYENLDDYNPIKKSRVLIVFDDIKADMEYNKKLSTIVTESFLRWKNSIFHISLYYNLILKYPKL